MIQQPHFWVYIQRNWKQSLRELFVSCVYNSLIHNSQEAEAASVHRQMNE